MTVFIPDTSQCDQGCNKAVFIEKNLNFFDF